MVLASRLRAEQGGSINEKKKRNKTKNKTNTTQKRGNKPDTNKYMSRGKKRKTKNGNKKKRKKGNETKNKTTTTQKRGIGALVVNYIKENYKDFDYIWGYQRYDVSNIDFFLKHRRIVAKKEEGVYTLQDLK